MSFELNGVFYQTDKEGYLENPENWNKEVAEYMASTVDTELTPEHWQVIEILRDYYQEYGYPPQVKVIVKTMQKRFGTEKGNYKYFYQLFPKGPYLQAYKIAGVSNPCKWM